MTIWFDMDGTIADLYSVENWLPMLRAYDPTPYANAKPLVRLATLAYMLHKVQAKGYKVGIISWLAKNSTDEYDTDVTLAKLRWLAKHLPSVKFNAIHIVPYGTPKYIYVAGAKKAEDGSLLSNGGRVLGVTAVAGTLKDAIDKAYALTKKVKFDGGFYRNDIGARALKALK